MKTFGAILVLLLSVSFASAQTTDRRPDSNGASGPTPQAETGKPGTPGKVAASEEAAAVTASGKPTVWIHLVGGRRMQVDDVTQMTDGVWYTQGNLSTFLDAARVIRIERSEPRRPDSPAAVVAGSGSWKISDSARVENFFLSRFKRRLPTTALGQSELHTRWGLDHRNGMDVGLHPDSSEGKELIKFLTSEAIPFLAFRGSIPGVATGPHIHVGNGSHRIGR
ncbi:MAG TPA: hypothetical protein VGW76_09530 [Pyrinomonadaceae bacterium]|nr:hypothetical protein [Pyrinomonadaceae bacterium]